MKNRKGWYCSGFITATFFFVKNRTLLPVTMRPGQLPPWPGMTGGAEMSLVRPYLLMKFQKCSSTRYFLCCKAPLAGQLNQVPFPFEASTCDPIQNLGSLRSMKGPLKSLTW